MQFVRAPDENVFIAPFNLIEIVCLIIPFEWWMPRDKYEKLNDYVMGVIYSPLLFVTALLETRTARIVKFNRSRQESDDDTIEEWEQLEPELDVGKSHLLKRTLTAATSSPPARVSEISKLSERLANDCIRGHWLVKAR